MSVVNNPYSKYYTPLTIPCLIDSSLRPSGLISGGSATIAGESRESVATVCPESMRAENAGLGFDSQREFQKVGAACSCLVVQGSRPDLLPLPRLRFRVVAVLFEFGASSVGPPDRGLARIPAAREPEFAVAEKLRLPSPR
jgi:hypothetical protein